MLPLNTEIRFEPTTVCTNRCVFCVNPCLKRRKETMTLDTFRFILDKIIAESDQYKSVSFAGIGDPLCDAELENKIAYVKKVRPDFYVPMVTNGSLINADRFKSLGFSGVDVIRISFHGANVAEYKSVHGVDKFYHVKHQLERILEVRALGDKPRIYMTMVVIEGENDKHIAEWVDLWIGRVDQFEVWRAHNWANKFSHRLPQAKIKTCGRVFSGPLQIQVNGDVVVCCFDPENELVIGNILDQSLKEIFSGSAYSKIKECHTTGNFEGSGLICENCDQRNCDKSEAIILSSRTNDLNDRVKRVSTTFERFDKTHG